MSLVLDKMTAQLQLCVLFMQKQSVDRTTLSDNVCCKNKNVMETSPRAFTHWLAAFQPKLEQLTLG